MSQPDEAVSVVLLEPSSAAEQIGVSASGLRRLAPIYEQVHGELPRKGQGDESKRARLWPTEAVERLRDARKLVELERYKTIAEALKALQAGVTVEQVELETGGRHADTDVATRQTLQRVLEELTALRAEVAELRSEVATVRVLPPGASSKRIDRALEVEMQEGRPDTERAEEIEGEHGTVQRPATGQRAAEASSDGLAVRAVRWLERRFRGR